MGKIKFFMVTTRTHSQNTSSYYEKDMYVHLIQNTVFTQIKKKKNVNISLGQISLFPWQQKIQGDLEIKLRRKIG